MRLNRRIIKNRENRKEVGKMKRKRKKRRVRNRI